METIYFTLIGFALWTLGLGVSLTTYRSILVLLGKKNQMNFRLECNMDRTSIGD